MWSASMLWAEQTRLVSDAILNVLVRKWVSFVFNNSLIFQQLLNSVTLS